MSLNFLKDNMTIGLNVQLQEEYDLGSMSSIFTLSYFMSSCEKWVRSLMQRLISKGSKYIRNQKIGVYYKQRYVSMWFAPYGEFW